MKVSFNTGNREFSTALNQEVHQYFVSAERKKTGNRKLYIKTAILLTTAFTIYGLLLFAGLPVWANILLCIALGFNLAGIGFNVMHDSGHGSYSPKTWVNYLMGASLNLMGGNIYIWKEKHNISHHSFTNIEGVDDDLDIRPWIRTNKNQPWKKFHRFQHLYSFFLYGFAYISWVFSRDFQKYFSGKVGDRPMKKMKVRDHFVFWGSKLTYVFAFIVFPVIILGWQALIGYLIFAFTCGLVISTVFQLAHVVESSEFPIVTQEDQNIEQDWAIYQVSTTANFSTRNKFMTWLLGGLNFQIEHHLFPRISHVHYPEISEIVKKVCSRFNVRHLEFPNIFRAIRSHLRYLKMVGEHP